jgi:hypothetical protein
MRFLRAKFLNISNKGIAKNNISKNPTKIIMQRARDIL